LIYTLSFSRRENSCPLDEKLWRVSKTTDNSRKCNSYIDWWYCTHTEDLRNDTC